MLEATNECWKFEVDSQSAKTFCMQFTLAKEIHHYRCPTFSWRSFSHPVGVFLRVFGIFFGCAPCPFDVMNGKWLG